MSHQVLAYLWHLLLALVWGVYLIQETFVIGASLLSLGYEKEGVKRINALVGTYWDGIQVWLILAVAGLFAAFPVLFAEILSFLYIPIFLLMYAIIFRGVSIELIFKMDNPSYQRGMIRVWQVSSFVLLLVVGVYLANLAVGFQENNRTFLNFLGIFNRVGLLGGLFLIAFSLTAAYNFIHLNLGEEYSQRVRKVAKGSAVLSALLVILILMGLNNRTPAFSTGLYAESPLIWAIPGLAIASLILAALFTLGRKSALSFLFSCLGMVCYVFTLFTSMIPYGFVIAQDREIGPGSILLLEGAASEITLTTMLIVTVIFLPVVIGYQLFKYIRFWGKD